MMMLCELAWRSGNLIPLSAVIPVDCVPTVIGIGMQSDEKPASDSD
ncbi:hypothetical protein CA13_47560 [Planctomycetes bacterium CA13]|uniref:Uncharacterized protein n=1 Tax=Novipirellula herctigrandis TaxID=2527986 RepID=A0A5C5Z8Z0_9BACT|nr:hypothetical protein CA13_47560 [Planctomycetes bacterium CA13]